VDVLGTLFGGTDRSPTLSLIFGSHLTMNALTFLLFNASSNGSEFIVVELGPPDLTNDQKKQLKERMHT
jgi:hypothetical protein